MYLSRLSNLDLEGRTSNSTAKRLWCPARENKNEIFICYFLSVISYVFPNGWINHIQAQKSSRGELSKQYGCQYNPRTCTRNWEYHLQQNSGRLFGSTSFIALILTINWIYSLLELHLYILTRFHSPNHPLVTSLQETGSKWSLERHFSC